MTDAKAVSVPRRRRWPKIVGTVFVLVAVTASAFWFAFVPNWRPTLHSGETFGIDVSNHQGAVDWRAVADDGVAFAYIKATEGGDFTDARFAANWRGAAKARLERGAYHFFTLCRPGLAQAQHFLSVAPPDSMALPPAVDLELAGNCKRRPSVAAVDAEVRSFLSAVETAWGRQVVVYAGHDWDSRYPARHELGRPLWHPRFLRRPGGPWVVWQIHGFARVDGIHGRVDIDIMRLEP